jgi:hypothetical protein
MLIAGLDPPRERERIMSQPASIRKSIRSRLPSIALIALAGGIFGCVQGISHELASVWARVLLPGIAAGCLAGAVSWILGRKEKT